VALEQSLRSGILGPVQVVELASKAAMAMNCEMAPEVRYDRKNYFYPDTPKNYQITQYLTPIGGKGSIELPSGKVVGITRLHMEEDSAKMLHQGADSLVS
jgi:aspartyl-tRNA(Asn)/glutamyl-tRNA(Gln) amidotransferase subunit B